MTDTRSDRELLVAGVSAILDAVKKSGGEVDRRANALAFFREKGGKGGAFQFKPGGLTWKSPETDPRTGKTTQYADRSGALFLEAALPDAKRPGFLDWDNKIVIALSVVDLSKIIYGVRTRNFDKWTTGSDDGIDCFHQNENKDWKKFALKPCDANSGSWFMELNQSKAGQKTRVAIKIDGPEVAALMVCAEWAIPECLGWNAV